MVRLLVLFVALFALPASAQVVQVTPLAPYAMQAEDGSWQGPAIDLVRQAADAAGTDVTFVETPASAAQLPVVAGAGSIADASLPLHVDTLAMIGQSRQQNFLTGLLDLLTVGFLVTIAAVCAVLLVFGVLFWLAERSASEEVEAEGSKLRGIGQGFWWAGVTATTIGYGDLVPKTLPGRLVAMVWMLISMALTAVLTAYIVSSVGGRDGGRELDEALSGKTVGYVEGFGAGESDLDGADAVRRFADVEDALAAYDADAVDGVIYPAALAKEVAGERSVLTLKDTSALIVARLPQGELREAVNRIVTSQRWQQRMAAQLGDR